MSRNALGTLVGIVLGLALAFGSFGQMLIVALGAGIGFAISKVVSGELDISPYLGNQRTKR